METQKQRPTRLFRSVEDFLNLPPAEIVPCLRAFQDWITRSQELRASAQRQGLPAASLNLGEFTWHAREEPSAQRPAAPYAGSTAIADLGLRPSAVRKLREMNLYALEDFTQSSEDELKGVPDVGAATVAQIRSLLHAAGLDFRESANPIRRAMERAKLARLLPPGERRVADDAPISELGLRPPTAYRCMEKGITTIGVLRDKPLRELWLAFGEKTVLEIMQTLDSVGLELTSRPTQLERWRSKAIAKEALVPPRDEEPVTELEPWLGDICGHLQRDGVATVGQAHALAAAGGRKVRGMGPHAWEKLLRHFGVGQSGANLPPSLR
ncbi:hypothetical protein [Ramlibacter sp. AN1133]|uniref:hypothetical protein n=1 Tax=Ramlibacter sp. AN1133 TaxID=3133429 RepID=UPI0030BDB36D